MTSSSKEAVSKIAMRVIRNPTSATLDDVRKLARAWIMETHGRLPVPQ